MKKYIFLLIAGFTISVSQSQEISDAIRYSQDNLNGTARFRAMSGAFGALGGDLSSLNVNPAGSSVFNNNQITATLSNFNVKNNSNYFNTATSTTDNSFDLNQTGGVFVFKNQNQNSDWKKFSIAINYENTNNFNNSVFSAGVNPTKSVDSYFLSYANANPQQNQLGIPLGTIRNNNYADLNFADQQAFLGYEGYIINAIPLASDPSNDKNPDIRSYSSNITPGVNYYQENSIMTNGYNGKLSFNAATSFQDKLYFGLNLNAHFLDYNKSSSFYESNSNALSNSDYTVKRLRFDNQLYTYGSGFSFQLGAIAKVSTEIRLGLAYESSTWYKLNDEFTQKLVSVSANTGGELPSDVVNPKITNYYELYKLQTPSKITGSFAYIFGKSGLISVDYSIKDYGSTKFTPENDTYFKSLNNQMSSTLTNTGELRIGAEYKIKQWSLRGGYRYEESPYKNATTIGNLKGYSGGFGYNFGSTKVDLAYSYAQRNSQQGYFSQGLTDGAKINTINNNVSMTLLFEL
ncbi:OmpP1/FadL family transporter [Flavobacterium cellulosilyticum]|uniref:Transporter n=1 Tax=Flavobacterium cellulosilyticum TaxID=2541731 RepID=A0A4R5CGM8_9FLAO|nr:outer membrane protein transport protein [Flavobacterium cellulosilyticum]TDD97433.1 transporter [Flavobacterium cellulosilyticum]